MHAEPFASHPSSYPIVLPRQIGFRQSPAVLLRQILTLGQPEDLTLRF